ncbi:chemotaxis protein CheY [Paraclostridium benzoelyticum]|uniref:Stage 0 sporulation protein A homolog n=1 Tax=Paraclostridium benzoelyticum TaxID=1629550 RepID=A0A0M3DJF0_9FIRM|nr:response regulator transcription factor [Paraclostridium benzoelyticum]KKY01492.1 chemotaxis protein CheY [Paraclostridium benzoelyticum]
MKLLIIEDEEDLANLLAKGLRNFGYIVDIAIDGREGLELFFINDYDLVVLDINLPSMDGRLILDEIRKENEECKVIILSARCDYSQRIEGLDKGANDYLVKPFDFGELAARIRSLLRRNFIQKNVKLKCNNIILDTALRCAYSCNNEHISLSPKEFALLEYLIVNKGRVVSSEELIEHVWDSDKYMFSNAVKVHISRLRKKLNPYCKNDIILNIRGEGYLINEN